MGTIVSAEPNSSFTNIKLVSVPFCKNFNGVFNLRTKMLGQNVLRMVARRNPSSLVKRGFHFETYISGPPRVRISLAEKCGHALFLMCAVTAGPMWVLYHLREYRGEVTEE